MGDSHAKVAMPMSLLGSVEKSSRRRDLVEVSLVYKFVICYIHSLVCNGIRCIPSQTNVRLGFCDRVVVAVK